MIESTKLPVLKYREVERILRAEIADGRWQPGERLPGEHELARRFEVAYMTLRQAITTLVEEGVLLRVRGKGTFIVDQDPPQMPLRTSHPMALLFPSNWQRVDPYYFPELLEGFQQRLEAQGHSIPLHQYEAAETPGVLEAGAAVACLLLEDTHRQLVERLRDNGYRVLAVNHYAGRRSIPCVRIDDAQGIESAVAHLVSRGHQKIGFLRGSRANIDADDRLRGFHAAVKHLGLTQAAEAGDGFGEAAGYAAACTLLSQPAPPTALVCASDLAAIGAIKAARELGFSVPGTLSVVGFGDFSVSDYVMPRLTTVRQSRVALGRAAADSLLLLADGKDAADTVLNAELVVRDSTAFCTSRSHP